MDGDVCLGRIRALAGRDVHWLQAAADMMKTGAQDGKCWFGVGRVCAQAAVQDVQEKYIKAMPSVVTCSAILFLLAARVR